MKRCAVIGAGWAGLSSAWHLQQGGCHVTVFEAAPRVGGRARSIEVSLAGQRLTLDNGQHLLIGAYRESLALIRAAQQTAEHEPLPNGLARQPLQFDSQALSLRRRGPGQLGLAIGFMTARGLDAQSRWSMMTMTVRLAIAGWCGFDGLTVATLMTRFGQTIQACERFWTPLCIAAMNTHPEQACAQTFVNVLYDAMVASPDGSDFLIPLDDLGAIFPEPMRRRLSAAGADIRPGQAVRSIAIKDRPTVVTRETSESFDDVIIATPAWQAAQLLESFEHAGAAALRRFQHEAIQTVFLAWNDTPGHALPVMRMLDENPDAHHYGQWFFARKPQAGLLIGAVVISVRARLSGLTNAELTTHIAAQVTTTLGLDTPIDTIAVNEKRATFRCTPDRPRIDATSVNGHTLPAGLALAGEYCLARYPGTLEAAVRSGRAAAEHACARPAFAGPGT